MIISHKHKFIFIHIPKCAGTSITYALAPYLGEEDFVFGCTPEGEKLNKEGLRSGGLWKHSTAMEVREMLGRRAWNSYYKFAFVRNPWDLLVSTYHWWLTTPWDDEKGTGKKIRALQDYEDYLLSSYRRTKNCLDLISDQDGNLLVDFVGKQEQIHRDFDNVCGKIGIPNIELPFENRSSHQKYTTYYNPLTMELMGQWFQRDISTFGYSFDEDEESPDIKVLNENSYSDPHVSHSPSILPGLRKRTPIHKFVVIGQPRTGSSLLLTFLRTKNTEVFPEIFHPSEIQIVMGKRWSSMCECMNAWQKSSVQDMQWRNQNRKAYVDLLFSIATKLNPHLTHIGFKYFYQHGEDYLWELVRNPEFKKIFVCRENILDQYLSREIAKVTDKWGLIHEEERVSVQVEFKNREFLLFAEQKTDQHLPFVEYLNESDPENYFITRYEDISVGNIDALTGFLGLESRSKTGLLKQNSIFTQDKVSNFDYLYRSLKGTIYEKCINFK